MAITRDTSGDSNVPAIASRCAEISLEDGGVVIYDAENHSAWIHSSLAVTPEL